MAWPARPQDTYGLEKLYAEEMCLAYAKDFPIKTRMARYHNVYGPRGTWKGTYVLLLFARALCAVLCCVLFCCAVLCKRCLDACLSLFHRKLEIFGARLKLAR